MTIENNVTLTSLKSVINKGFIEKEYEVLGYKWKLKIINQKEQTQSNAYVDNYGIVNDAGARIAALRVPMLARSIVSINGKDVVNVFKEKINIEDFKDESGNVDKEFYNLAIIKQIENLLENMDPKNTNELFNKYLDLIEEKEKTVKQLKNSSADQPMK